MPYKPPPNRIRVLRVERGMTQEQLATAAGCTPGQISRWETGALPTMLIRNAARVARALGVGIDDLGLAKLTEDPAELAASGSPF